MGKYIDLTNQTFGRLTVLERSNLKPYGTGAFWVCKCSCGQKRVVSSYKLTTGHTQSCGCFKRDIHTKYSSAAESALQTMYKGIRRNAPDRNLACTLTYDQFVSLVKQPCYYCGTTTNKLRLTIGYNRVVLIKINGIDRFDNALGYTATNSVPCCSRCNIAKARMSAFEYIELCKAVAKRHTNANTS